MKLKRSKKIFFLVFPLFLVLGIFLIGNYVHAGWATTIVSNFLSIFIFAFGLILGLVIRGLIYIASYQNFINVQVVILGWETVRDIANMFFVVVLMIIAFGTILHLENYDYKKWLPKLIIMAVLINFSKTICGLLIDIAQVAMLTFVNAFKAMGGANMTDMLGISKIVTMAKSNGSSSFSTIVGAYILGIFYLLTAVVVITTMMVVLAMRLVMIWIYVVLSPLAYLLAAFPGGQKYASQWWSEFTKNLIIGPVLAFFIWLSLASLSGINNMALTPQQKIKINNQGTSYNNSIVASRPNTGQPNPIGTQASTPSALIAFVVGIGMLIGGLKISQEIGGAAGGIAGKGMAKINRGTAFAGNFAGNFAKRQVQEVGRAVRNNGLGTASMLSKGAGGITTWMAKGKETKVSSILKTLGNTGLAWRSDMMKKNKKNKQVKRQQFLEKMGMGEKAMDVTSEFLKTDTGKEVSSAVNVGAMGAGIGTGFGPIGAAVGGAVGFLGGGLISHFAGKGKDSKHKWWGKLTGNIQSFTSETTQKAAAHGSVEIANARQNVKSASKDAGGFMRDSSGYTFYSNTGGQAKKTIEQLASKDNPDATTARDNLRDLINNDGPEMHNAHSMDFVAGLAKGIAAAKKGGMDVSRLQEIINAIDSHNGGQGDIHGLKGATVGSLEDNVIAYRHSSKDSEHGSGQLAVGTLANNTQNEAGKNIVGVDFSKLKEQGVEIDSEGLGANVSGANMVNISGAIIKEINTEQSNLQEARNSGEISETEFSKRNANLDKAKEKLSNPEELKNLSLVNTASKDYGRQERMTTVYHEEIHKGGVQDEDLTENIAQSLMGNKLYGRNASSGGRHATEIATFAKGLKDKNMSNGDIMKEVDKEIKSRLKMEGESRAARVINKETGHKESESEATGGENNASKPDSPEIDTEGLQRSIDQLSEKFNKFKLESPDLLASLSPQKFKGGMDTYALRTLFKKIVSSNNRLAKRLSTPLEAKVLINTEKT